MVLFKKNVLINLLFVSSVTTSVSFSDCKLMACLERTYDFCKVVCKEVLETLTDPNNFYADKVNLFDSLGCYRGYYFRIKDRLYIYTAEGGHMLGNTYCPTTCPISTSDLYAGSNQDYRTGYCMFHNGGIRVFDLYNYMTHDFLY